MTVLLADDKILYLKELIKEALASKDSVSIHFIAKIIGHMIGSLPAVQYAWWLVLSMA